MDQAGVEDRHSFARMIVEVEADFLSQDASIRAFASTRERLRGSMHERIFKDSAQPADQGR